MRSTIGVVIVALLSICSPSLAATAPQEPSRAVVFLRARDAGELERLAKAVSDPSSSRYRRYATADEMRARFDPLPETVALLRAWAAVSGLEVTHLASNGAIAIVRGSPRSLDSALPVQMPESLRRAILAVSVIPDSGGPAVPFTAPVNPGPCSSTWGAIVADSEPLAYGTRHPWVMCGYEPAELQSAYGVRQAVEGGIDGRGQAVAVMGVGSSPTIEQDVAEHARRHALPPVDLTIVAPLGSTSTAGTPVVNPTAPEIYHVEQALDIEAIHALAPGARIVYRSMPTHRRADFLAAVNDVVANRQASIISYSVAAAETRSELAIPEDAAQEEILMRAAAQGVGIYVAAGDSGDGIPDPCCMSWRHVSVPANSPWVTAVGGTTLAVGPGGARLFETPWGTYGSNLDDAGRWAPEPPGEFVFGGGGGTSRFIAQPDYQRTVVPDGIANYYRERDTSSDVVSPGRALPDVAAIGDPATGFTIGLTLHYPDGQDRYGEYPEGGTSLSAPVFAGIMALADQAAGTPRGFSNPAFYKLAGSAAFHDIVPAVKPVAVVRRKYVDNADYSKGVVTTLRTTGVLGTLTAAPGYDDSTGLGTPNGLGFLRALAPGSALLAALGSRIPVGGAELESTAGSSDLHAGRRPACPMVLTVAFRRPAGSYVVRAAVYVDRRLRKVRRGKNLRSIRLRRPTRRAFAMRVVARTRRGGRLTFKRSVPACRPAA